MLTVADVAERLGVSVSLVYEIVAKGDISCYRIGPRRGAIRFEEEDVDAYLKSRRQPAARSDSAKPRKHQPARDWF